ncbi:aspartate aminotransferase family protein [Cohnella caldifontis]|uniref:aspartate aminotransferase family protein n=1 Tax=Cohnella caldifontis TaxID=3027471 RepID=UPI0023ED8330|nr:aspartate aminotransferase family protein [Cohnella sp. YIM B05605]
MKSFEKSKTMFAESETVLAGGVASSLRASMKPVPVFAESASGSRIRDVDGNEYIDFLLAYGPSVLGHAHPELIASLHEAMQRGITYGVQHRGEIELARRLTEVLPCADKVAFSGSGTEAVMLALRLARAYTGKKKIVRFHGHYHGWSDTIFTSFPSADMKPSAGASGSAEAVMPGTGGQSELSLREIILLPWNDAAVLEQTLRERAGEIAAVITEPVMCNSGCIRPLPGYLEKMRELTAELGIVLIFDEVITGFRLGLGGAHGRFGIKPDLMTMGKALAGGIALSAVAGAGAIMELIANGRVSHLGTLNGNGAAMAAALTTLDILGRNGGEMFPKMDALAQRAAEGLREKLRKFGFRGVVNQIGPVFHLMFIERDRVDTFEDFSRRDSSLYFEFAERMLEEGVLIRTNGLWYVSIAHEERDIELMLEAADRVLQAMAADRKREG